MLILGFNKIQPVKGQRGGKASNSRAYDYNIFLWSIGLSFDD
jgi:hypothetical protein